MELGIQLLTLPHETPISVESKRYRANIYFTSILLHFGKILGNFHWQKYSISRVRQKIIQLLLFFVFRDEAPYALKILGNLFFGTT